MNYKNKQTGQVISERCYNSLMSGQQLFYNPTSEEMTHKVVIDSDSDSGILTAIVLGELLSDEDNDTGPSDNSLDSGSSDSDSGSVDFGGGGFDGGGSGGDF